MNELPCVGAGITVVDPGPNTDSVFRKQAEGRVLSPRSSGRKPPRKKRASRASWHEPALRLLKAFVVESIQPSDYIAWKCGIREGHLSLLEEGSTWVRGHGPQARGALLAARALERQR